MVDAYALALAALLLASGSLADLLGRRRVFVVGLGDLLDRLAPVRARRLARDAERLSRGSRGPAAR